MMADVQIMLACCSGLPCPLAGDNGPREHVPSALRIAFD